MGRSVLVHCKTCGRDMTEEYKDSDCKHQECSICVNSRIMKILHENPRAEYEELHKRCELGLGERERVIETLTWLVADAKHRFDDCKDNLENGSEGGYSDELSEAIELLDELKKGVSSSDKDTFLKAYKAGFEDAKKQIMEKVQLLVK